MSVEVRSRRYTVPSSHTPPHTATLPLHTLLGSSKSARFSSPASSTSSPPTRPAQSPVALAMQTQVRSSRRKLIEASPPKLPEMASPCIAPATPGDVAHTPSGVCGWSAGDSSASASSSEISASDSDNMSVSLGEDSSEAEEDEPEDLQPFPSLPRLRSRSNSTSTVDVAEERESGKTRRTRMESLLRRNRMRDRHAYGESAPPINAAAAPAHHNLQQSPQRFAASFADQQSRNNTAERVLPSLSSSDSPDFGSSSGIWPAHSLSPEQRSHGGAWLIRSAVAGSTPTCDDSPLLHSTRNITLPSSAMSAIASYSSSPPSFPSMHSSSTSAFLSSFLLGDTHEQQQRENGTADEEEQRDSKRRRGGSSDETRHASISPRKGIRTSHMASFRSSRSSSNTVGFGVMASGVTDPSTVMHSSVSFDFEGSGGGATVAAGTQHSSSMALLSAAASASASVSASAGGASASATSSSSSSSTTPPAPPATPPLGAVPFGYLRTLGEEMDTASLRRLIAYLYRLPGDEFGHRTVGHACVSREELARAAEQHHDLLYGEVLPVGATKMFDSEHLDVRSARTLCDLGSGLGKLALQAFLQFPNLRRVTGCELAESRFAKSAEAIKQLKTLKEYMRNQLLQQQKQQQQRRAMAEVDSADSDSERMMDAQAQADADEGEESKSNGGLGAHTHTPTLPLLSLHIEDSSHDDGSVRMIRFEESLRNNSIHHPHRSSALLRSGTHAALLAHAESFGAVDPGWSDLQMLERCANEHDSIDSSSEGERDASPELGNSPSLLLPGRSGGGPPALSSFLTCPSRSLEFVCGDLFAQREALQADIVICETKFDEMLYPKLCTFLAGMKQGCRLLTYENLDMIFHRVYGPAADQTESKEGEPAFACLGSGGEFDPTTTTAPRIESRRDHKRKRESRRNNGNSVSSVRAAASAVDSLEIRSPEGPSAAEGTGCGVVSAVVSAAAALLPASLLARAPANIASRSPAVAAATAVAATPAGASSAPPMFYPSHPRNPFQQLAINVSKCDRFFTTWATNQGHHFFIWRRR